MRFAMPPSFACVRRLWPDPVEVADVHALVAADARPAPAHRPWLLVNMISSLDGAITIDHRSGGLGRPADKALFHALRGVADVILAGAGTARAEGYGPARPSEEVRALRRARGQVEVPPIALVSRSLALDLDAPLFRDATSRTIVITCASAPADARQAIAERADLIVAGDDAVDLTAALATLHERGVAVITCEGGPRLNGDLLLEDLIDEWALTLTPLLVGGESDRAAHGALAPAPRGYALDRILEGDGLLLTRWLRAT
jgi:riboflavin biosynthesis pyrimidine reductase